MNLLPCPHCGNVPDAPACFRLADGVKYGFVSCGCTEVNTGYTNVKTWAPFAVEAWNVRAELDLSTVTTEALYSEIGRRRGAKRVSQNRGKTGRKKVMRPCPKCGGEFATVELRKHKPRCGKAQ